jgi:hypothetical protein
MNSISGVVLRRFRQLGSGVKRGLPAGPSGRPYPNAELKNGKEDEEEGEMRTAWSGKRRLRR